MMKHAIRFVALLLIVGAVWLGWEIVRAFRARAIAARHMVRAEWLPARSELVRYLRLRPGDAHARLMLAESFARDDALDGQESTRLAIDQMQRVPDTSPFAAKARAQEARLRLFILNQPIAAERLLRRAIELDVNNYDAYFILWKLLDMTGRAHLTEDLFWRVYELSPVRERPFRLREWYLSEFSPGSEMAPFDRSMGFLEESEKPGVLVDFKRLQQFVFAEPNSSIAAAAVARLFLREHLRDKARDALDQVDSLEGAYDEPYYIATRVNMLLEFGEFDLAEDIFKRWPEPHSSFEYWKYEAIILDEIEHDDQRAIAAYDKALAVWPGNGDWQLMFRKAHCLNRLGRTDEANSLRTEAARIEKLLGRELHVRLREALSQLDDAQSIATVADFYRQMHRNREAAAWDDYRDQLPARGTTALRLPVDGK